MISGGYSGYRGKTIGRIFTLEEEVKLATELFGPEYTSYLRYIGKIADCNICNRELTISEHTLIYFKKNEGGYETCCSENCANIAFFRDN